MNSVLADVLIYLGSALMVSNIYRYNRFSGYIRQSGSWQRQEKALHIPVVLLVLFLAGYLTVALFGKPDMVVAGIFLGGSIFVGIVIWMMQAIAEQIREHEHLEAELEAERKAGRAKTVFLSNMSHDIRTPINAVLGYTALAKREGLTEKERGDYIEKIENSGKELIAIIDDVLEMSRIDSGNIRLNPEPVELTCLFDHVSELFAVQMQGKKITFERSREGVERRQVLCDRNRLSRILMNFISNAYKYTPEGGSVFFGMKEESASEDEVSYVFTVRDNGIGMSEEFVRNLFTPFERERTSTVSRVQGTGLGMSIAKNLADLMGGTIGVKTKKGEGSEFTLSISFPACKEQDGTFAGCGKKTISTVPGGLRVLLVEDNPVNTEIASEILLQAGFEVDTAQNGKIAVEKVEEGEKYDVILMDIQMPVMDGYEAAGKIRALPDPEKAGTPIVAMTANAFREDIMNAKAAGMNGHISKPIDIAKMMETLSLAVSAGSADSFYE